jgi:hypothetical protein
MRKVMKAMIGFHICKDAGDDLCVPVSGPQKIVIMKGAVPIATVLSDEDGYVALFLPPGNYTLLVNGGCPVPLKNWGPAQVITICSKCAT